MKQDELELLRTRGEAPLVRLRRELDGFPVGTLGSIVGVQAGCLRVKLAGDEGTSLLYPHEVEDV